MVFDDDAAGSSSAGAGGEALPDLAQLAASASGGPPRAGSGKRRERAARKEAAAAARTQRRRGGADSADATELGDLLSKIPFVTDDDGKILPSKVLEAGAWLGIFLLVAWELYLNSPLFDRAAPMAPVVY
jgi:hypothetical protein